MVTQWTLTECEADPPPQVRSLLEAYPAIAQLVEHLIVVYLMLNNTINLVIKAQIVPCSIHGGWTFDAAA